MMPQTVNIIIIVCAVAALAWGAWKGFTSQVVGLAGLILGIWVAAKFSPAVVKWIDSLFGGGTQIGIIKIIVYILLVILVILICRLLGKALEGAVKLTMLGPVNTIFGALFSLAKVLLVLSVVACIMNYTCEAMELGGIEEIKQSSGFNFLLRFADKVFPHLKSLFLCTTA